MTKPLTEMTPDELLDAFETALIDDFDSASAIRAEIKRRLELWERY